VRSSWPRVDWQGSNDEEPARRYSAEDSLMEENHTERQQRAFSWKEHRRTRRRSSAGNRHRHDSGLSRSPGSAKFRRPRNRKRDSPIWTSEFSIVRLLINLCPAVAIAPTFEDPGFQIVSLDCVARRANAHFVEIPGHRLAWRGSRQETRFTARIRTTRRARREIKQAVSSALWIWI
jgi:hypothetical protein